MTAYWAVELVGHEADLAEVERALNPHFDPKVDRVNGKLSLVSDEFADLDNASDVRDRARAIIDVMNGAVLLLRGAQPLRCGCVFRVQENGQIDQSIMMEAMLVSRPILMTATLVVTDRDGNAAPPPPPTPTDAQKWMQAAMNDDDIADVLSFLGRADNWFDLYKTIEIAEEIVGDERKLRRLLGSDGDTFKNVRTTANWHRHARTHKPANPATLEEARVFANLAVRKAIESKVR